MIWNVVGRRPLCSPRLHPIDKDSQVESKSTRDLGEMCNPRWRMSGEEINIAILARRNLELN